MNMNTFVHPTTEKVNRAQIQLSNLARINALKWLAQQFPEAFDTESRVRPLKKGILKDILAYLDKQNDLQISRSKIRQAVVMFTRRMEYLVCVKCRNDRIDLNGDYAGDVTDDEAEFAAERIRLHVEAAIEKADKPPRSRRYEACEKFAPRARDVQRKEKKEYPSEHSYPMSDYSLNSAPSSHVSAVNSSAAIPSTTAPVAQTQVTVKRKVSKRIDPEAVERLKAKLRIKKKESA